MARTRRGLVLALVVAACCAASSLRTLHVEALSMRADRTSLHLGEVFHVAIHIRVAENVAALDELVVPDVGTMQLLGDERSVTHSARGTDVTETLTLEPTAPGRFTLAPAYLDAIDARDGRPKRFSADRPVRVEVAPATGRGALAHTLRMLLGATIAALGALAAVTALLALVRSRRARSARRPVAPAPAAPEAAPAPPSPHERAARALQAYRLRPGAPELRALRAELFAAAETPPGATLRDALAKTHDDRLRRALRAAEAAAFGVRDDGRTEAQLIEAASAWLE